MLFGLNIPDVGWVTAQNLARHFGNVDRLAAATQEEIEEVDGIGPDRAESIAEWFADDANRALVEELRALGLRFEIGEEERPVEGPLTGNTYVITGTLEAFSARRGGGARSRRWERRSRTPCRRRRRALVVGEEPGDSKLTKAQKLGVALLDRGRAARATAVG